MSRRTSIYSLFPYTTLFRSELLLLCTFPAFCPLWNFVSAISSMLVKSWLVKATVAVKPYVFDLPGTAHTLSTLDRKSTRLNSSHVRISYAVFCLKKKIHTQY